MTKKQRIKWLQNHNTKLSDIALYTAYCVNQAIRKGYGIYYISNLDNLNKCCCPAGSVLLQNDLQVTSLTNNTILDNMFWNIAYLATASYSINKYYSVPNNVIKELCVYINNSPTYYAKTKEQWIDIANILKKHSL